MAEQVALGLCPLLPNYGYGLLQQVAAIAGAERVNVVEPAGVDISIAPHDGASIQGVG
jgi:hypothetical protein